MDNLFIENLLKH